MAEAAAAHPAHVVVDRTALRRRISEARTIHDFVSIYDSADYQAALRRLRLAVGDGDPWEWARAWAIRMRTANPDDNDSELNQDRSVCLKLLYELCELVKKGVVTEREVVDVYSAHRVVNVLQYCLPMDRAQALYKMTYPVATEYGMHWIARDQINDEWIQILGDGYADKTTLNNRILMLLNMEGLGLSDIEVFQKWTVPTRYDTLKD